MKHWREQHEGADEDFFWSAHASHSGPLSPPTPVASSGALQQSRKHFKTRMKTRLLLPWAMLLAPALAFAIPTEKELSP